MESVLEQLTMGNIEILSAMTNEELHYIAQMINESSNKC